MNAADDVARRRPKRPRDDVAAGTDHPACQAKIARTVTTEEDEGVRPTLRGENAVARTHPWLADEAHAAVDALPASARPTDDAAAAAPPPAIEAQDAQDVHRSRITALEVPANPPGIAVSVPGPPSNSCLSAAPTVESKIPAVEVATPPSDSPVNMAAARQSQVPADEAPASLPAKFESLRMTTLEVSKNQPGMAVSVPDPPSNTSTSAAPTVESNRPAVEVATRPSDAPVNLEATRESQVPADADEAPASLPVKFEPLPPAANVEKFVERWTCDVCHSCSFATFDEAHAHEIQCRLFHDARENAEEEEPSEATISRNATLHSSLSLCPPQGVPKKGARAPAPRTAAIDLVPADDESSRLSRYNDLLVRHVEFFYPSSDDRVGLRCVHCRDHPQHVAAATFFPSAVGSISSGLGTIGARHFGGGKCPCVPADVQRHMRDAKATSGLETRSRGRIGLDAHCKDLARRCGIRNDARAGIYWREGTVPHCALADDPCQRPPSTSSRESASHVADPRGAPDGTSIASILAGMKNDMNIETRPFVPGDTENFWECSGCRPHPFEFRAKGSVVFSVGEPSAEKIKGHLEVCTGGTPLSIPQTAVLEPFHGPGVPTVKVKWDGSSSRRTSGRTRRYETTSIAPGVEDVALCLPDDRQFTTEFAFYTMSHLKKCRLTKAGGSRGTCPVGFPGLACGHCAGSPHARRFFYTSADHLRNSFSHIPTHMAECRACPPAVKARLDELKTLRNRQKSQLKPGSHKIFIDRVWERMHAGFALDDHSDDDGVASALPCPRPSMPSYGESVSTLVSDADRVSTSDLCFFTLQQVEPYQTVGYNEHSREIGFPGLVCRHCRPRPTGRKFFTVSGEHLGGLLLSIAEHLAICEGGPAAVQARVAGHQKTHGAQLRRLPAGAHGSLMQRVWHRLCQDSRDVGTMHRVRHAVTSHAGRVLPGNAVARATPIQYKTVDPSLRLGDLERFVTPFTYFTMQQVRPCNLDDSGNGSRSAFDFGFPGLECIHCAGQSNVRRFFYRTAEILSGNYAHIPNHLAICSACPPAIKRELKEKKDAHLNLKHTLPKGSQKMFFTSLWERLHSQGLPPAES